jgi:hypothetical protein
VPSIVRLKHEPPFSQNSLAARPVHREFKIFGLLGPKNFTGDFEENVRSGFIEIE